MEISGPSSGAIAATTRMGPVRLTVSDAPRVAGFYTSVLGLAALDGEPGITALGGADGEPLVELVEERAAPERPRGTTGLFHLALLVPSRPDLARALRRVLAHGWSFDGASDHLVSEALYLRDPEGNGIEIYRDRPREEWRHVAGQLQMDTLPLDARGVMAEIPPGGGDDPLPAGTRIGHVHLQVADLESAEAFYCGVLGFEVTVRGYPGALFVAAGGYHHHLGLNVWAGHGAPPPPAGARGLRAARVVVPHAGEAARIQARADGAGVATERTADGVAMTDPSGNRVVVSVGGQPAA